MYTETFSYLPPMTQAEVEKQVQYILDHNWIPGIEYTEKLDPYNSFWHMWKLPLFDAQTVEDVMQELEACKQANSDCFIKLTGYDNKIQGQVLSFVVHKPENEFK